jgi:hypothetical protein
MKNVSVTIPVVKSSSGPQPLSFYHRAAHSEHKRRSSNRGSGLMEAILRILERAGGRNPDLLLKIENSLV